MGGGVLKGSGIQHLTVNVAVVIVTETHRASVYLMLDGSQRETKLACGGFRMGWGRGQSMGCSNS